MEIIIFLKKKKYQQLEGNYWNCECIDVQKGCARYLWEKESRGISE